MSLRFKLLAGALASSTALILVLRLMTLGPWATSKDGAAAGKPALQVGYLPVTCHLTCPVLDFSSKITPTRFEALRFTDFPSVVESVKAGRLDASFMILPLAMKLREQGLPVKIVYLGHRDGSTLIIRKNDPATGLAGLKGKILAIPSRYSNQYLVLIKLMQKQGISLTDINFVELAPPDMPAALAAGSIDAYFVGEPHAAKAEFDGTGRVLYMAKDIWPGFISCGLVVTERLINDKPSVVADLVRGIAESGEWADAHRLEAASVAAPYFKQNRALVEYVLTQPPDRVSYRMLTPGDQELELMQETAISAGLLHKHVDIAQLVDRRFIPPDLHQADIKAPPQETRQQ